MTAPAEERTRGMTADDLARGICRFCGCQERTPCDGGCAWTDDSETLCTTCLAAVAVLQLLVPALGLFAAKPKHGLHVARAKWEALGLEEQRRLVLEIRKYLDVVQSQIAAELGERAQDNAEELDIIASFLLEHAADALAKPDATIASVVIGLLTPHVGHRIVLAGGHGR